MACFLTSFEVTGIDCTYHTIVASDGSVNVAIPAPGSGNPPAPEMPAQSVWKLHIFITLPQGDLAAFEFLDCCGLWRPGGVGRVASGSGRGPAGRFLSGLAGGLVREIGSGRDVPWHRQNRVPPSAHARRSEPGRQGDSSFLAEHPAVPDPPDA